FIYELAARPEFDWRRLAVKRVVELAEEARDARQAGQTVTIVCEKSEGPQLKIQPPTGSSTSLDPAASSQSAKPTESL
ncbi:MAG: hypothetical protein GTO03_13265, partial [Planctomycetales bacterium]|nr:hypothetical protein [Planctomycetales bacterium]